ncbi:MAG TPA: NADH-quinone oxidoreductase subunit NuoF [Candidatus Limnocylindrales bacterium]|nr:NADH-quinone oxidoreductase subunit NuoF [Candidatus Limnocylindrales bacterium]
MSQHVLLRYRDVSVDLRQIDNYIADGGYKTARRVFNEMTPEQVLETVKESNLRGRGGAGFPTGLKWSFLAKGTGKPIYLLCNADESEPGTFKDRAIMDNDPHQLLEGMMISAWAIGCIDAYIYIRGEFAFGADVLLKAISEAKAKGFLGKNVFGTTRELNIHVHRGAGAYICGEETGLIESLEGKRAHPRIKPPFPAVYGVFGCPTIVNNVETLVCVRHILERGAAWFKGIGPDSGPGPKLYCVSGHVKRPGTYELPMGTPLMDLIFEHCGGMLPGRKLKAVIPGGSSVPVLKADECDIAMDFDSVAKAGSMLGSAGIIVMDDSTDMVAALRRIAHFYHHESCGQCTPCREGTGWLEKILIRLDEGRASEGDLVTLDTVAKGMLGTTICVLSDAAAMPVRSFLAKFPEEFQAAARGGVAPLATADSQHAAA